MPEAVEVEQIRRWFENNLLGRYVAASLRVGENWCAGILRHVERKGKQIRISLDGYKIYVHFGLTGGIRVVLNAERVVTMGDVGGKRTLGPWMGSISTPEDIALVPEEFRDNEKDKPVISVNLHGGIAATIHAVMEPVATSAAEVNWQRLGPDILNAPLPDLMSALQTVGNRNVESVLSDQKIICGLGKRLRQVGYDATPQVEPKAKLSKLTHDVRNQLLENIREHCRQQLEKNQS